MPNAPPVPPASEGAELFETAVAVVADRIDPAEAEKLRTDAPRLVKELGRHARDFQAQLTLTALWTHLACAIFLAVAKALAGGIRTSFRGYVMTLAHRFVETGISVDAWDAHDMFTARGPGETAAGGGPSPQAIWPVWEAACRAGPGHPDYDRAAKRARWLLDQVAGYGWRLEVRPGPDAEIVPATDYEAWRPRGWEGRVPHAIRAEIMSLRPIVAAQLQAEGIVVACGEGP